jgi:putative nucleotidyltransferase with HDIG domain
MTAPNAFNEFELTAILEQLNQITGATPLDDLPDRLVALIVEVTGARGGVLSLYHPPHFVPIVIFEGDQSLLNNRESFARKLERVTELITRRNETIRGEIALPEGRLPTLSVPLAIENKSVGVFHLFGGARAEPALIQLIGNRVVSELDKWQLLEASRERSKRLEALVDIIGQIGSTLERDSILATIINHAHELLDAEASSLFLKDEASGELVMHITSNLPESQKKQIRVPAGQGIIGQVVETGQTIIVNRASADRRHYIAADQLTGFETRSVLAVPLISRAVELGSQQGETRERIIGGLEALNKISGDFSDEDANILQTLATQAGTVLRIAQSYADANELFIDVIRVLTAAIDAKDPYTRGHSQRVAAFSVAIARHLKLDAHTVHRVRVGGILHDVGKIGVSDTILRKPGRLTPEEMAQMQEHPTIGVNIMQRVRSLQNELPALAEHHERLDGSGYPRQLAGDQISTLGRIVAVADVFDAMTSDRPYRKAIPTDEVLAHLREGSGIIYDANCVAALIEAYELGEIVPQAETQPLPVAAP